MGYYAVTSHFSQAILPSLKGATPLLRLASADAAQQGSNQT